MLGRRYLFSLVPLPAQLVACMVVVAVETGPPMRIALTDDQVGQTCYVARILGELISWPLLAPAVL